MDPKIAETQRTGVLSRVFLAGVGAALVMTAAMALLRATTGTPSLPEILGEALISLMPASVFSAILDVMQYAAKPTLFAGIFVGMLAVGGLLGKGFAYGDLTWRRAFTLAAVVWAAFGLVVLPHARGRAVRRQRGPGGDDHPGDPARAGRRQLRRGVAAAAPRHRVHRHGPGHQSASAGRAGRAGRLAGGAGGRRDGLAGAAGGQRPDEHGRPRAAVAGRAGGSGGRGIDGVIGSDVGPSIGPEPGEAAPASGAAAPPNAGAAPTPARSVPRIDAPSSPDDRQGESGGPGAVRRAEAQLRGPDPERLLHRLEEPDRSVRGA